ncbi:hypothetical protein ScalyP_jg7391 [Parmales sp. scaly parma]|nr:hypothetical protein ScalyP_jg7391 [Parmales sp. scaly parma]
MINIMTVNSYSTEIVEKLDDLAFLQSAGRLWETIPMLFYLIGVTVVALRTNMTVLEKSSFAQISATIITLPFILSLSKLFGTRPALHNIEGKSYLSVGFIQVRSTFHKIRTKHPEAAKFLIAMAFFESATVSIVQLSITYLKSQLKIQDPNKFIVFCVVMMLPAVVATPRFVKKCGGTKKALQIILILLFSTTIFLTLFVHKPEHSAMLVLVGGLFGLGIGSIQSIQRSFYLCVVPSGNEAEMFGIYVLFTQILGFLPNLIFSVCNELLGSIRFATLVLFLFHFVGFVLVSRVDYEKGRREASASDHLRIKSTRILSPADSEKKVIPIPKIQLEETL